MCCCQMANRVSHFASWIVMRSPAVSSEVRDLRIILRSTVREANLHVTGRSETIAALPSFPLTFVDILLGVARKALLRAG